MGVTPNGHKRRQLARRAEILAAATEVFLAEGYGRASMDSVHAKIGGSKRTLYSHFPSKDDLFYAIVVNVSSRVHKALQPTLGDGDIRATLIDMGVEYLSVLTSPEGLALYRAMVSEALHFPELSKTFFNEGPGRASQHLAAFFEEQASRGVLPVTDTLLAAGQFLGMVRGDVHLAAILGARKATKPRIQKAVHKAVDTFLQGVSSAPESA